MSIDKSFFRQTVVKSASIISLATFCSRLLGFARDAVIARLFGVYTYAQAFVIAFKIPNLLRDFVGEGATNAALVPVFTEYRLRHTKEEFWELANVVLNIMLIVLLGIVFLGIVASPIIVRLIAPGFINSPEKLFVTVKLTRILFPYILLVCLSAYSMAILNSLRHFVVSAFAPCLLNISLIAFALIFGEGIKGLSLGVLVGGVLQLAVQLPLLYKKGFRLKLFRNFQHPSAKVITRLMLPRMLSSFIYQLNNFVDSIFGSLAWIVGDGGVAILYFSYRLIQFPLGIFSNALSQAILPEFSAQALGEERESLKNTLTFGLQALFLVMLPAALAFMVLGRPIISALFGGGKFDPYSIDMTSRALFFYSIGLCAYAGTKMLQSCFFALRDTLTPTKVAFLALITNIILNSILMFPLKIGGLALATSISGISSFLILFFILQKRLGSLNHKKIILSFLRILAASIAMGIVCYFAAQINFFDKFLNLGVAIISGVLSYIGFCFIFRVKEMQALWQQMGKRKII